MDIKISLENYLDENEIKEACKSAIRDVVFEKYSKEAEFDRLLTNLSYEFIFKQVSELIKEDSVLLISKKVKEILQDKNTIRYEIFRKADAWERSESIGISLLNQAIKDNEKVLKEKVKETFEQYDFGNTEEIKEVIEECVHEYIGTKLFNQSEQLKK